MMPLLQATVAPATAAQGAAIQGPEAPPIPELPPAAGAEGIVVQPGGGVRINTDGLVTPEMVDIAQILGGVLLALIIVGPLLRFALRMIERKTDRGMLPAKEVSAQLRELQESVDAMAIEVERVSEAQRFQAKLLSERARAELPATDR